VGVHKHMSIAAAITTNCSGKPLTEWLRTKGMRVLEESTPFIISSMTKIMVNGTWVGVVHKPTRIVDEFKLFRRLGLIPIFTSILWDIANMTIFIYTDSGRMCRPIFYIDNDGAASFDKTSY